MTIYIITIFFIFLLALTEVYNLLSSSYKKYFSYILYLILVLQVGLRWETGTDWTPYFDNFLATTNLTIVVFNSLIGFEIGYGFFVFLIRSFTENYTFFLIIHAIIFYFLIFKANRLISPFPFFSLMLFYVSTIGVLGSNRQLIALAICMYSLKFVIEKKPFHFLISVMFAFLFHSSALLFLVYYFLNRDFSKLHILAMLLIAFVIGKSSLPSIAFSGLGNLMSEASASKVSTYSEKGSLGDFSLSLIGFVRRITYFIIFIWSYNSLTKKWPSYKLMFNGFLFGLLFYLAFSSSLLILVNRGSLYFNIMEVFLITCQLLFFKSHKNILAILFVIFLYSFYIFFQSISVYSDLFLPYKGIFINSEYKRDLY